MSAPLAIFAFESAAVRTVQRAGEPWFVATDIASILGYRDAANMVRMLDADEAGTHNLSIRSETGVEQMREVAIINESGLYACILKSRRTEAKAFRKWVTGEVLPALRRQGAYALPGGEAAPQFLTGNPAHGADLAVAADRTFRSFLRAGRSAGLSLPTALRTANQQTLARTGIDMLTEMAIDPDAVPEKSRKASSAENDPALEADPDAPLVIALKNWVESAPAGYYRPGEILKAAFGINHGTRAFHRGSIVAARVLRNLGWRTRKMRMGGDPRSYWYPEGYEG